MSLMKSFNFKFLKENIKKSKGGIILSLIIVPLILSIYMVLTGINSNNTNYISHNQIGGLNIVFMYIIPFLYSVYLFGFVFKRPSTDFMNSMPVNRKTLFVTNTIGGIALITLIQLFTAIFTFLWGAVFDKIIIFPADVLETFVLSWFSYVFIFISANLAMTFSGTVQTQFVVTILILFLIPVCNEFLQIVKQIDNNTFYYDDSSDSENYDLSITDGYQVTHYDLLTATKGYTMPFKLIRYGWNFSWSTVIRMLVLSIIYFFIGLKLYENRKMENNEESFGSVKLHIIIKALTLIPVLLIANFVDVSDDPTALIVIVILSAVYYFVFDLIVKRKVPFKTSVISFAITIFIIQASIMAIKSVNNEDKIDLDYEDIKSVSIGENSRTSNYYGLYRETINMENFLDGDYFIEDDEILDLILDAKAKSENKNNNTNYDDNEYSSKNLYFNIKLYSGREYNMRIYITEKYYNRIMNKLKKNKDYLNHMKDVILSKNGVYEIEDDIFDSKTENFVKNEIKNNIEKVTTSITDDEVFYITKNVYQNHRLENYKIPINLTDNLMKKVAEFSNKCAVKNIRGYKRNIGVSVYKDKVVIKRINNNEEILDFIEQHYNDEFDPNKNYYILDGNLYTRDGYKNFIFYTNEINEVNKMVNSEVYDFDDYIY